MTDAAQCPNALVQKADQIASYAFCLEEGNPRCSATPISDAMLTSEDAEGLSFESVCEAFEKHLKEKGGEKAISSMDTVFAWVSEQKTRRRLRVQPNETVKRRLQISINPNATCDDPVNEPCTICPVPENETIYTPFTPDYTPPGGSYQDSVASLIGPFITDDPWFESRSDDNAVAGAVIALETNRIAQAAFALCEFIPRTLPIPIPFVGIVRIPNPIYLVCKAPELAFIVLVQAFEILLDQVDFHDGNIDSAEIEAAWRNSVSLLLGFCKLQADVEAAADLIERTINTEHALTRDLVRRELDFIRDTDAFQEHETRVNVSNEHEITKQLIANETLEFSLKIRSAFESLRFRLDQQDEQLRIIRRLLITPKILRPEWRENNTDCGEPDDDTYKPPPYRRLSLSEDEQTDPATLDEILWLKDGTLPLPSELQALRCPPPPSADQEGACAADTVLCGVNLTAMASRFVPSPPPPKSLSGKVSAGKETIKETPLPTAESVFGGKIEDPLLKGLGPMASLQPSPHKLEPVVSLDAFPFLRESLKEMEGAEAEGDGRFGIPEEIKGATTTTTIQPTVPPLTQSGQPTVAPVEPGLGENPKDEPTIAPPNVTTTTTMATTTTTMPTTTTMATTTTTTPAPSGCRCSEAEVTAATFNDPRFTGSATEVNLLFTVALGCDFEWNPANFEEMIFVEIQDNLGNVLTQGSGLVDIAENLGWEGRDEVQNENYAAQIAGVSSQSLGVNFSSPLVESWDYRTTVDSSVYNPSRNYTATFQYECLEGSTSLDSFAASETLVPLCKCLPEGITLSSAQTSSIGGDRIEVVINTANCEGAVPFESFRFELRNGTSGETFPLDSPSLRGGGDTQLTILLVASQGNVPDGPDIEVVVTTCDDLQIPIAVERVTPGTLIPNQNLTTVWVNQGRVPGQTTVVGRFSADLTLCQPLENPIPSSSIVLTNSNGMTIPITDAVLENLNESSGIATYSFSVTGGGSFDLTETYSLSVTVCGGSAQVLNPWGITNGTATAGTPDFDFQVPELPDITLP
uniref:Uncharacterized protein n=1 Tax=Chromera velia CCMP2878 TaxID=1169474 RepID=A0A0G4IER5_9ALVE|eukprot:Cvel_13721.t1-p1 / transcript=Cvel_13721.t1 / gene=Cvel_13721 / organism=Chromera_velia_CCMP2878 / gene_product=hypothetical protein / transcript_product=hypothetical protein / location=Cvel_scaffold949:414-8227(+) / protein_length=1033 / sequence_SO=supercontig / SO=protein_coding / is_pseudo=false